MNLKQCQEAAIAHIEQYAAGRKDKANKVIEEVRAMSNIAPEVLSEAIAQIKTNASVALHFHPDRLSPNLQPVAANLLESGFYKNQFETKLSNGMLSPYPGGPRDIWENDVFGGAFSSTDVDCADRPKYGALDLMRHPDGPSPRFGSCYFVLNPAVSQRCTFTYMDSYRNPAEKGTINTFEDIIAGLLAECFERQFALGIHITPTKLIGHLVNELKNQYPDPSGMPAVRNLNHYIEAQVHGPISLRDDVEFLVADPSFKDNNTGELLENICKTYHIRLLWHGGFQISTTEVPTDFRGPAMPSLAKRIAGDGYVTAHKIGEAAAALNRNPDKWGDRGTYEQCLQELKLLWHVLVQFGEPLKS